MKADFLQDSYAFQLLFETPTAISRHLRKSGQSLPPDHRMLQISLSSFQCLASNLELPARFVAAIPRHFQVCGTGIRKTNSTTWDYWCLVPVRVTIPCYAQDEEHAKSTAGSNQMDPFHYIHLGGAKVDIRGSHVAVYIRRHADPGRSVVVVVNLLDGRWGNVVEEPLTRVKETLGKESSRDHLQGPLFVLLIYLSAILQWWNNVLWCFHRQLVMHEKSLQQVIADETSAFSTLSKDINKHLHIMAAHLHRYNSELNRLQYILEEIMKEQICEPTDPGGHTRLVQLMSKSNVIRNFCDELERKVQNILTLATNDRTLQAILITTQDDTSVSRQVAIQSHELSRSMKKDSIAMKTAR
ncbi:hypothetical protein FDECE_9053 [Fusarium decemcellulare]|nr:hypothetical protein FDECE_9053 [Fusarium decemcellulare]